MNDLEWAKHEAAVKLLQLVNRHRGASPDQPLYDDSEAVAVVEALGVFVIKTIEYYLSQPVESADERRAGNGE